MLLLLSPAKSLDFDTAAPTTEYTQPRLLAHSAKLIEEARKMQRDDVMKLMRVSEKIADLNVARFADWALPFSIKNSKPALFAFTGDVYQGMNPLAWTASETNLAQSKIRILSGLYGILRPLDLMQAYRLEMGCALPNENGKNLYAFWKNTLTKTLNDDLKTANMDIVLNLASDEYFKALDTKMLQANLINTTFKEERNGKLKIISFSAKRARGSMADFVIRNNITQITDLQAFNTDNYTYRTDLSAENNLVFTR
jgi:cytoplasmic iron level regulating protein YaaA (DUF328/UPF0246 family)